MSAKESPGLESVLQMLNASDSISSSTFSEWPKRDW